MENTTTLGIAVLGVSFAFHLAMVGSATAATLAARRRPRGVRRHRSVSILKPLAGEDDELYENLASFARIAHPDYEVLFGVAAAADPAARVAREVMRNHPSLRARLIVTDPDAAMNPKVAQLIGLAALTKGELLVISDSNVRVAPGYLAALEHELDADANAGLVTSLIAGSGEQSLGSAVENLQLCAYVAPAVAAATLLAGRPLTIGKSMAIRRDALVAIGGFASVGNVLAEDHLLGRFVREAGFTVRLSCQPVENRNIGCNARRTLERHTRWAKMRRAIAPVAFALEPITEPLVVGALVLALAPSRETIAAFAAVLAWKLLSSWAITSLLRRRILPLRYVPLEIVRTALGLFCWLRACTTRRIEWRGHAFVLGPDSLIQTSRPSVASLRAR